MNRIFNVIGWLGVAVVLAALGVRFFLPARDQYATYLAWAGLVCIVLYLLSQWRDILGYFKTRQARYGTLAASSVFIMLGVLVAINYIGKQQNKRWDLTSTKQYSLSDQSRNVVSKLDAPLEVQVFARDVQFQPFRDRLQQYEYASKQVKTTYVDIERQPELTRQNKIAEEGTIIFNYKGRSERTTQNAEQDITNGIIKVVSGQAKKVYFTQGHGEKDATSQDRDGYNGIGQVLGRENYGVEKLALAQTSAVPDDATVVVVAGPKIDFFPPEIDALKAYLAKGGKLLLLLDPPDKADAPPLTNLIALAHEWGIDVGNDIVVDVSGMGRLFGASEAMPVALTYPPHPITERFENVMTVYQLARSVTPVAGGVSGHTAQKIVETSDRSWAESDVKTLLSPKPTARLDPGADKQGPISLGAAVSASVTTPPADPAKPAEADAPKRETRVVVFGDSDFPANSMLGLSGNGDLFMNAVGWLSQQENLISIRPKNAADQRMTLTAAQQSAVVWLSMLLIPGAIFGTGVYGWWRRR
jgi:ABC-type uncharacterized transport system involved in gliding motility auxiliary subunit